MAIFRRKEQEHTVEYLTQEESKKRLNMVHRKMLTSGSLAAATGVSAVVYAVSKFPHFNANDPISIILFNYTNYTQAAGDAYAALIGGSLASGVFTIRFGDAIGESNPSVLGRASGYAIKGAGFSLIVANVVSQDVPISLHPLGVHMASSGAFFGLMPVGIMVYGIDKFKHNKIVGMTSIVVGSASAVASGLAIDAGINFPGSHNDAIYEFSAIGLFGMWTLAVSTSRYIVNAARKVKGFFMRTNRQEEELEPELSAV